MNLWQTPETLHPLDVPQSDVGAPLPHVLADDYKIAFAYHVVSPGLGWNYETEEPCAVVGLPSYSALRFGPPNDEALGGHRLARLGLRSYSAYEVESSAWIAEMEVMNRVHDRHDAALFRTRRHFVFTFHDSLLEIVAREPPRAELRAGPLPQLVLDAFLALG